MATPASSESEDDDGSSVRVVEILDETTQIADDALGIIRRAFPPRERQPTEQIAMEIAEKRLGLLTSYDFHLLTALTPEDEAVAVASGVYLDGVNAGFVTYLAVHPNQRGSGVGGSLRAALIQAFQDDARRSDWPDLAAVVGEVRAESPWLRHLVKDPDVLPLELNYFHPGEDPSDPDTAWVLYRQAISDFRPELPALEVRQLLFAIWRRAYRVRWPLERDGFIAMLQELEGREKVGRWSNFEF